MNLAEQLAAEGIQRIVLESTSEYWRPFYYLLEARGLTGVGRQRPRCEERAGQAQDKLDAVWPPS